MNLLICRYIYTIYQFRKLENQSRETKIDEPGNHVENNIIHQILENNYIIVIYLIFIITT